MREGSRDVEKDLNFSGEERGKGLGRRKKKYDLERSREEKHCPDRGRKLYEARGQQF